MAEACRVCRFWSVDKATHEEDRPVLEGDIAFGFCRRNAPRVLGELVTLMVPRPVWGRDGLEIQDHEIWSTQINRASIQPATESADWCGEFRKLGRH